MMGHKKILPVFLAIAAYAAVSYLIQSRSPNIADPDGFYHIRHAWLWRTRGLSDISFPWTQHSVLNDWGNNLWFGFQLLLIPFTFFTDLVKGIKVSSFFLAFASLLIMAFAFRRLSTRWTFFWPLFYIFSVPNNQFRAVMVRPHAITTALLLLHFAFLINGSHWPLFILSYAIGFIHASLVPFTVFITLATVAVISVIEKNIRLKAFVWTIAGLFAGLLSRPQPLVGLKLFMVQMKDIYLLKIEGLKLSVGFELQPLAKADFFPHILPLLVVLASVFGLAILFFRKKLFWQQTGRFKGALLVSALMTVLFGLNAFISAKRSIDLTTLFATVFFSLLITAFPVKTKFKTALYCLFIGLAIYSTYFSARFFKDSPPPTAFKTPALWLKENTEAGSVVFNMYWDQFPEFFFWNQHNYYINGLGAVFMYLHDPKLYWKNHHLMRNTTSTTVCGLPKCAPEQLEDTHKSLAKEFKAKYIYVLKIAHPAMYRYLEEDSRYRKAYDYGKGAVFEILPVLPK